MTFQSGRLAVRLPRLALQHLGHRRTVLSSSCVERVPALCNVSQSQHYSNLVLRYRSSTPSLRRTYAQRAVSRPKAHTGRTTTAARKAPTTSKTKAAKVPAPQKTRPKAVPKANSKAKPRIKGKPRIKAKPKPAKKKKTKAKAKPQPKRKKSKVLTEAQKSAALVRKLKTTALKPPHSNGAHTTTWLVFSQERIKSSEVGFNLDTSMTNIAAEYKKLTPEQVEHYNHLSNQRKVAIEAAYRQWIESHTPTVIYQANLARSYLRRLGKIIPLLQDHRQVKGRRTAYIYFSQQRRQTGDFRGLKIQEAAKLIGREWRGLQASEKKPFQDLADQDMTRYIQERKTVLNKDIHKKV